MSDTANQQEHSFKSLAIPTIGAGTGGLSEARSIENIERAAKASGFAGEVVIVRYLA
jgi:O-acetyl-ADP-ribose deacetylase (regulator of RNase III)